MRSLAIVLLAPALIGAAPPSPNARLKQIIAPVSGAQMKRTVEKLVGFGTRHTLSSQTDPKRGIGAAVRWAEARMKGFGLKTLQTCDTVTGRRIPTPTRVCNAVAIQRGTERPNDVVIITGHIDSRVSDPMDAVNDAPGANDDGSGTAAVIEAARILSKHKFPATIVYAALSGEEQGLHGGKIMADYAKGQGWNVVANLNNDIIGNSCGSDGVCDNAHVRVFSEGPRWQGHEELAALQRSLGGENDSPSRNLSRWLAGLAERLAIGLGVRQIWRNDRHGRGGDHTEFLNAGFPAVRMSVAVENYDAQHQDVREETEICIDCGGNGQRRIAYGDTIDRMDFRYLEKVAKLNVAALAALASAPPPPAPVVEGAVSIDTLVNWTPVAGAVAYLVRWRRTDANNWQHVRRVAADTRTPIADPSATPGPNSPTTLVGYGVPLKGIRVDDWVFGVSSVSADGFESPVASAVPGGAFKPWVAPPPEK